MDVSTSNTSVAIQDLLCPRTCGVCCGVSKKLVLCIFSRYFSYYIFNLYLVILDTTPMPWNRMFLFCIVCVIAFSYITASSFPEITIFYCWAAVGFCVSILFVYVSVTIMMNFPLTDKDLSYDHLASGLKLALEKDKNALDSDRLQNYTGKNFSWGSCVRFKSSFCIFWTSASGSRSRECFSASGINCIFLEMSFHCVDCGSRWMNSYKFCLTGCNGILSV